MWFLWVKINYSFKAILLKSLIFWDLNWHIAMNNLLLNVVWKCAALSILILSSEVESLRTSFASRTSLASRTSSRTHFEVLGLGLDLEAQVLGLSLKPFKSSKMSCPRLEDSIVFWLVERKITNHKHYLNSGIGVARIFDWGARSANHPQYDVIRNVQKKDFT